MKARKFFQGFIFFIFIIQINIDCHQWEIENLNYYKVSKVRIYITNEPDLLSLNNFGVLIDNYTITENYLETVLDSIQIDILRSNNYRYEILIDDLTQDFLEKNSLYTKNLKLLKKDNNSLFNYGSMGGYYTYTEVIKQLDTLRYLYPSLISKKDSIGKSIEGKTIWAVKISDNADIQEEEPKIFYNSLIHAREPLGMMSLLYFMCYLLENYGSDAEVTYLINNRELYFVPVINPDGYVFNEQTSPLGGGYWRKNRRENENGIFGVDLNRNFGYQWGYDDFGSSLNSSSNIYRGTYPFSEPEAQAIRDLCIKHNFAIAINYHSFGNFVIPPWGYENIATIDSNIFNGLINLANSTNGYDTFWPYSFNGNIMDWMYGEQDEKDKIFAIVTEIGPSFWPTVDKILPIAEDNLHANLVYAWGPKIIQDLPYVSDVKIDRAYLNPTSDILDFQISEEKSDYSTSKLFAQIINENDSISNEIELGSTDESLNYSWPTNLGEEEFYNLRIKQKGTDIPFKFYSQYSKFTTAGPIVVDSIEITKVLDGNATVKPFLKNLGNFKPIENIEVKLISQDSIINIIFPKVLHLNIIMPGEIKKPENYFSINYDEDNFNGNFNLVFEIGSNDYFYWTDSTNSIITKISNNVSSPSEFALKQNYPNPFNPLTTIEYSIPKSSFITLKVYDVLGREVVTLINKERPAGFHFVKFDGTNLSSGIYFYKLSADDFHEVKKLALTK